MTRQEEDLVDALAHQLTPGDPLSIDYDGDILFAGRRPDELVGRYGSPLFVVSAETVRDNLRRIEQAFRPAWPRPVRVRYALKANDSLAIRAILSGAGAGGECYNLAELYATVLGGCPSRDVVMNGPNKSKDQVAAAARLGVMLNVDSAEEVSWLEQIDAGPGGEIRVCVRLRAAHSARAGQAPGVELGFSRQAAAEVVRRLRARPGVQLCGVSIHIGPPAADPDVCTAAAAQLASDVAGLHTETSFFPELVNVGGGWVHERQAGWCCGEALRPGVGKYARRFCEALQRGLPSEMPVPELWLEPGQYLVSNAAVLLTRVETVRQDEGSRWVFLDATALNHTPTIGSAVLHPVACTKGRTGIGRRTRAAFSSPMLLDDIATTAARGDVLAVLDVGAYAEGLQSPYKGTPLAATVLVDGDRPEVVIRPRSSIEDLYARQVVPPWLEDQLRRADAQQVIVLAGDR